MRVVCLADHLSQPATTTVKALLKSITKEIGKDTSEAVKADLAKDGTAKWYLPSGELVKAHTER